MDEVALVIGESLVDVVRDAAGQVTEYAGGSAANVAVALARLGRPTRLATAFAADRAGQLIADHLARNGVELAGDSGAVRQTSIARATLGADGGASYEFDIEWQLHSVPTDNAAVRVVHVCSLGAVLAPGDAEVHRAVARLTGTALVSYDLNIRPAVTGTGPDLVAAVERMVAASDLVKASDEDLALLYPGTDPLDAGSRLLDLGPAAVVVTRGAAGATWLDPGRATQVTPAPVQVADTIGAGDTFGAAVLDGLWARDALDRQRLAALAPDAVAEVLGHAARAAAVTVSRPGADPPYRHELRDLPDPASPG